MKLLIVTQKVDQNDQLLGFSLRWFRLLAQKFSSITILCLERGEFDLPENIQVISLGKDKGDSKLVQLLNFYKNAWLFRKEYDAVFVFMNAIWVIVGWCPWRLLDKKVFLWYAHKTITWKHRLAEKMVMVVGQGIDMDFFRPDKTKRPDHLSILSVGRIAPIKNYEILIRSAEILRNQGIDFHITMIGEPVFREDIEYERNLKSIVSEMGLDKYITFVGKIVNKELPLHYQSSHIFVNLGKTGSLDKTIVEAMACGVNVISSNDAAIKFLPKELIVGGSDPKELFEKIKEISNKDFGA